MGGIPDTNSSVQGSESLTTDSSDVVISILIGYLILVGVDGMLSFIYVTVLTPFICFAGPTPKLNCL